MISIILFFVIQIATTFRSFFFFQAEDGIRDADVTGVQTCALPIFSVTAISVALAVQARQLATVEREGREQAEQAADELEKETALSLIGPLDPKGAGTLSQPEVEALWRLAGTSNERVRQRFLEEAFRTETTASQLRHRAAWFVHGAVGLAPERRERAERLLVEGMRDPDRSFSHRCEIAWVALELSESGSP